MKNNRTFRKYICAMRLTEDKRAKYNEKGEKFMHIDSTSGTVLLPFWNKAVTAKDTKRYVTNAYHKGVDQGASVGCVSWVYPATVFFMLLVLISFFSITKILGPLKHVEKARCSESGVLEVLVEYPDDSEIWRKTNLDLCKHWDQP